MRTRKNGIALIIGAIPPNLKLLPSNRKPLISQDLRGFTFSLELQTDSNGYKQKSLILRHFQKRLDPINHYKKEK